MSWKFVDTSYYLALMNANDVAHNKAKNFAETSDATLLTTSFVLTEIADCLAAVSLRPAFAKFMTDIHADEKTTVIYPTDSLFYQAIDLYRDRLDKDWTLTDCVSFVVVQHYGIKEAVTIDERFKQAGFKILL